MTNEITPLAQFSPTPREIPFTAEHQTMLVEIHMAVMELKNAIASFDPSTMPPFVRKLLGL